MAKTLTQTELNVLRKCAKSMLSTPNFMDHRISLQTWAANASPEVILILLDEIEKLRAAQCWVVTDNATSTIIHGPFFTQRRAENERLHELNDTNENPKYRVELWKDMKQ